jgi:hypothetical protein
MFIDLKYEIAIHRVMLFDEWLLILDEVYIRSHTVGDK